MSNWLIDSLREKRHFPYCKCLAALKKLTFGENVLARKGFFKKLMLKLVVTASLTSPISRKIAA